ncbi:MAG: hypothetical protein ABIE68_03040 [bacterium]
MGSLQLGELGRVNAFFKKLKIPAGETMQNVFDRVLCGDFEAELVLREIIKSLFNKFGRRIPKNLAAAVCDANYNFRLDQPALTEGVHYANRILRLHGKLGVDTGITAKQLKAETERLLELLKQNEQLANITNGVHLPLVLPQLTIDDIGDELERYLEVVGKSYTEAFPGREFLNHRKGTLSGQVSIVPDSRQEELRELRRQGPVIALYFPQATQGFSINADREQMATLPSEFILPGTEIPIAMIMWADVLTHSYKTPGLDLAALSWKSADYSLDFWTDDDRLDFGSAGSLRYALGNYSSGVLYIGELAKAA